LGGASISDSGSILAPEVKNAGSHESGSQNGASILEELMAISDIVKFGFGVIGTLVVLHGPFHLQEEMRKMEFQILHEAARTDNWGNPSVYAGHGREHIHAVSRLSPIRHIQR
jgi:hypothetical protein